MSVGTLEELIREILNYFIIKIRDRDFHFLIKHSPNCKKKHKLWKSNISEVDYITRLGSNDRNNLYSCCFKKEKFTHIFLTIQKNWYWDELGKTTRDQMSQISKTG